MDNGLIRCARSVGCCSRQLSWCCSLRPRPALTLDRAQGLPWRGRLWWCSWPFVRPYCCSHLADPHAVAHPVSVTSPGSQPPSGFPRANCPIRPYYATRGASIRSAACFRRPRRWRGRRSRRRQSRQTQHLRFPHARPESVSAKAQLGGDPAATACPSPGQTPHSAGQGRRGQEQTILERLEGIRHCQMHPPRADYFSSSETSRRPALGHVRSRSPRDVRNVSPYTTKAQQSGEKTGGEVHVVVRKANTVRAELIGPPHQLHPDRGPLKLTFIVTIKGSSHAALKIDGAKTRPRP
jgi:hypothetical protein